MSAYRHARVCRCSLPATTGRINALARYTITITAEQPGESSAKVAVEYTQRRGARVLEWSVVAGPNGHNAPPVLEAIIAAIDGDGTGNTRRAAPSSPADLGLSSAVVSTLWKAGITRVPQLTALTKPELLRLAGLRRTHTNEIVKALARFDLGLVDRAGRATNSPDLAAESTGRPASTPPAGQRVPRQRVTRSESRKERSRPYRLAPNNLADLYTQYAGSPAAIAKAQGVPRQTVNNWLRTARNNGRLPIATPRLGTG
jgi:hypothetical protein